MGEYTFVGEFLLLRLVRIAILVLRLLVHMFRERLESYRASTFPGEGDCSVGLMHLMPRQPILRHRSRGVRLYLMANDFLLFRILKNLLQIVHSM